MSRSEDYLQRMRIEKIRMRVEARKELEAARAAVRKEIELTNK